MYQQFHLVPTLRVIHNVNAGNLGRWSWPKALLSLVFPQDVPHALADEAIASLDPERSRAVMTLLTRLCAEQGRALMVSLHDLEMAQQVCDRIVGLRQGRMVFDVRAEALQRSQVEVLYELTP